MANVTKIKKGYPYGQHVRALSHEKLCEFLTALSNCGIVTEAARRAGHAPVVFYRWRGNDEEFKKAWDEALALGKLAFEDEAMRRAFIGWDEPVIHQGQEMTKTVIDNDSGEVMEAVPVVVRKRSDTLMIFLLKGMFPEKYKERIKSEIDNKGSLGLDELDLTKLSQDELEMLKNLAQKAAPADTGGS